MTLRLQPTAAGREHEVITLRSGSVRFHLLVGEDYQVGRKDCRIIVSKDQSVSRKHAVIRVIHPEGNLGKPSLPSTVELQDSSKFGTLVNGSKITLGSKVTLNDGDEVTFGAMNTNKWKLTRKPLLVAFSSISSPEKKQLKALVLKLGGHVASEWSKECTLLIMKQLSVTIKVTAALITCRPIVTPEYLHKMKEAAQNDTDMPNTTGFRPPVIEEAVDTKEVSFDPNPVRSTLFEDKTFIFLAAKQLKQLRHTVEFGGGKVVLMEEGDQQMFSAITKPNNIVMYADPDDSLQAPTQNTQDWIRDVMQHLKKNGLRPIPASELGLAVLYASTQLHCNPRVAQAGLDLLNAAPSQPTLQPEVLAADTEASCSRPSLNVTSNNDRSRGSVNTQQKAPVSSSSEDERKAKAVQQTKKRPRQDSVPDTASKVLKLEPPSPAPKGKSTSSKIEVVETPQKSSESLQSGPSIKTSPEFSFVGRPMSSKSTPSVKQEMISPPAARNVNAEVINPPLGQRSEVMKDEDQKSEVMKDEEEAMEMDSDLEESSSVKIKDRSDGLQSGKLKSNVKPKKKGKAETLDSIWDLEVGGSRQRKRRVEEDALKEDEEKRSADRGHDAEKATDDLEESQNTMWKKKQKRSVLKQIEEDEARESQLSQEQENGSERPDFSQVLSDVPGGFLTAANPPKEEETTAKIELKDEPEADGQDAPVPHAVVSIEEGSLVIRRPKPRQPSTSAIIGRTKVKNFKKFKKAGYAGQAGMPNIIGGRDLEEHCNKPNEEVDDMMFGAHQAEQRRTKDEELAERLFADEPRMKKSRRR